MANKKTTKKRNTQKSDAWIFNIFYSLVFILIFLIGFLKLGELGVFLSNCTKYLFGTYGFVILAFIFYGIMYAIIKKKAFPFKIKTFSGVCFLILALLLWCSLPTNKELVGFDALGYFLANVQFGSVHGITELQGGILGTFLYSIISYLISWLGVVLVIVFSCILALVMLVKKELFDQAKNSLSGLFSFFEDTDETEEAIPEVYEKPKKKKKSLFMTAEKETVVNNDVNYDEVDLFEHEPIEVKPDNEDVIGTLSPENAHGISVKNVKTYKPGMTFRLPPYSTLDNVPLKSKSNANQVAAEAKGKKLIEVLANFGVQAELIGMHIGPSVTKFEIRPDSSTKVSKINNISDNIKMELQARDIRIEAPIPGRSAVGVEIPNVETTMVKMLELIRNFPNEKREDKLTFVLGKDLLGRAVYCDLVKMPHLLIAGATGSGKSVCMNAIITSFLLRTKPDEVKLLLIDPKKVEFTPYHSVPHLIGPVISDSNEASLALKVVVKIMEDRYEAFSSEHVRNISAYNDKIKSQTDDKSQLMPYIVVIIDELADLMAVAGKEVELSIQRITQLARAAGIHLIVATQRPSTDVITGLIKSNIPSRIAFAVSSGIDSRTILDSVGAERLLGYGDMLYLPIGDPSATRLQGVFVTDDEVRRVAEFVSLQAAPHYSDEFVRLEEVDGGIGTSNSNGNSSNDPLYNEVKEYVIDVQKASTSLLQRRFGIGYNRAARIIDLLEANGVIGPAQGSKPRTVYEKKEV